MDEIRYYRCSACGDEWEASTAVTCPACDAAELESSDEPPGAGADPFGRPDPRTHPEFWTE